MEHSLQNISELCRDPMLAVTQGRISMMNLAAHRLFPALAVGDAALPALPEHLVLETAESFLSSALVEETTYTVSARRSGETLLLAFFSEPVPENRSMVSDALLSGLLSALFNIELAADRLQHRLAGDEESADCLAILYHNFYVMSHRLSNLNTMQQLQESGLRLIPSSLDLVNLCRDLVLSVNHLTSPQLPRIEFSSTVASLPACVDASKVERIIINLLSNALKHTPKDGWIRLHLSRRGENAVFSVDDNGSGILPAQMNNIFHSYDNRSDPRDLTGIGTGGLGLALCRALAELHGGVLILESREGEGTSVRAMLPLKPSDDKLYSRLPIYETQGMNFLLSELCDVLDSSVYRTSYLD